MLNLLKKSWTKNETIVQNGEHNHKSWKLKTQWFEDIGHELLVPTGASRGGALSRTAPFAIQCEQESMVLKAQAKAKQRNYKTFYETQYCPRRNYYWINSVKGGSSNS